MKNKKTFYLIILSVIMLFSAVFAGCNGINDDGSVVSTLTLEEKNIVIEKGKTVTLSAKIPEGTESEFTWYSYDKEIATVDASGVVKAVGVGSTTILAMVDDMTASCEVNVITPDKPAETLTVEINKTELVLNSEKRNGNTYQLETTVLYNSREVNAQVGWNSNNTEYVTVSATGLVMAVKNGGSATLTATVSYNGIKTTSTVLVYTEKSAVIKVADERIDVYPKDVLSLEYSLFIDGVENDEEKANVTFTSSNEKCVTVSSTGEIKAVSNGASVVEIRYGSNKQQVLVRVFDVVYVRNAEEFLQIDGASDTTKFVLKNNIDLGGYIYSNTKINADCLIEDFNSVLDGNGYAVTGIFRFNGTADLGFGGIFKNVSSGAVIKNLCLRADVKVTHTGALLSKNFLGSMENCFIDIKAVTESPSEFGGCTIENSNGKVSNSVFAIDYSDEEGNSAKYTAFSNFGLAKYDKCLFVSNAVDYGALINGENSSANLFVTNCYYFDNIGLENAKTLTGDGIGSDVTLVLSDVLSDEVWNLSGAISLKNATNSVVPDAIEIGKATYTDVKVGTQVTVQIPSVTDGAIFGYRIIDGNGNDVTAGTVKGNVFTPSYASRYTVIMKAEKNGITGLATTPITVFKNELSANASNVILRPTESFELQIDGYRSTELDYHSDNVKVATVDSDGKITAVANGVAKITAVSRTGVDYLSITVDVVTDYIAITSAEELLAIDGATYDKYYVLQNDIDLTEVAFKRHSNDGHADQINEYWIKNFGGTLDGQGYTIKVRYNSDTANIMCGLFFQIDKTGVVKNIVYDFVGHYKRTTKAVYLGVFTYYLYGTLEDSFFNAVCYPDKDPGGEGFAALFLNTDAKFPTAYAYNCIFRMTTIVDGKTVNSGYAFRYGSRQPRATDCVFIRNGETVAFFGEHPSGTGSAVENTDCYFYRTLYDFVNARNGSSYSTRKVVTPVSNGMIVYHDWVDHWTISKNSISLCGKKIEDIEYEHYEESSAMSIENDKGLISWEESGEFDVYVDDVHVATVNNGGFDLADYILKNKTVVDADYGVVIRNAKKSGATIFSVRTLNQSNFVSRMRESTKNGGSEYFVLTENVVLDYGVIGTTDGTMMTNVSEWTANKDKQYTTADIKLWNCFYAFGEFSATLNGRGYRLTLDLSGEVSYVASLWKNIGGLFTQLTGSIENLNYEYKSELNKNITANYGFFVGVVGTDATLKNCVLKAEINLNGFTDGASLTGMIARVDGNGVSRNIIDFIAYDGENNPVYEQYDAIGGVNKTATTVSDVVWIKHGTQAFSTVTVSTDVAITSGYIEYTSYTEAATDRIFTDSDSWSVVGGTIKLCGKNI